MMTSSSMRGDSEKARHLGIKAFVTKPVKRKLLQRLIEEAAGQPSAPPQRRPESTDSEEVKTNKPLRVLLVEDNPVNRKVATRMLEKCGHTVEAVGNGRDAVEASRKKTF